MAKGTRHLLMACAKVMPSREAYTRMCARLAPMRKKARMVAKLTKLKK
jgi:hypothetical protein